MRTLVSILTIATSIYLLLVLMFYLFQDRMVFLSDFPNRALIASPSDFGLDYEDVSLTTSDNERLHGWYIPAVDPRGVLLFFHGNAGNISHRLGSLQIFHDLGLSTFIFDYRGYGQSEGEPSEKGTYLDARAAMEYLRSRPDVDPDRIVYLGHSLGAAVAVELSLTQPPKALVLVSPFASVRDMASLTLPFPPAGWLVRNHYDSVSRIQTLNVPVLVLHGDLDETVPKSQGRRLYEAANQPKRFQVLEGAAHNDTYEAAAEQYWEAIETFLGEVQ